MKVVDPGAVLEENYDYYGSDLPNNPMNTGSLSGCITKCKETAGCHAFSYHNNGNCYLKYARAKSATRRDGVISGMVVRGFELTSGGSVQSSDTGSGTCKPVCGEKNICGIGGCSLSSSQNNLVNAKNVPKLQLADGALFSDATGLSPSWLLNSAASVTESTMCNMLPVYKPSEMNKAVLSQTPPQLRDSAKKACENVVSSVPQAGGSPAKLYYLAAGYALLLAAKPRGICFATRPCPTAGNTFVIGADGMAVELSPIPFLPPGTAIGLELVSFGYYGDKQFGTDSKHKMLEFTQEGYGNDNIMTLDSHVFTKANAYVSFNVGKQVTASVTGEISLGVDYDYDNNGAGGKDHAVMLSFEANAELSALDGKFKLTLPGKFTGDVLWKVNSNNELVEFKTQATLRADLNKLTSLLDNGAVKVIGESLRYLNYIINIEVEARFMLTVVGTKWIARLMATMEVSIKNDVLYNIAKILGAPTKVKADCGFALIGDGAKVTQITVRFDIAFSRRAEIMEAASALRGTVDVGADDSGISLTVATCQGSRDELCPKGMRCLVDVCVNPRHLPTLRGCFTDRDCPPGLGCTVKENAMSTLKGFIGRCAAPGYNVTAGYGAIAASLKPLPGARDISPQRKEEVSRLLKSTPISAGARFVPAGYF